MDGAAHGDALAVEQNAVLKEFEMAKRARRKPKLAFDDGKNGLPVPMIFHNVIHSNRISSVFGASRDFFSILYLYYIMSAPILQDFFRRSPKKPSFPTKRYFLPKQMPFYGKWAQKAGIFWLFFGKEISVLVILPFFHKK